MIQRIQSLFLLLAAACAFGLFALPFAETGTTVQSSELFADAAYNLNDNIALLILFAAAGAMAFISIFLFKNRKSQLLLGRFSIIANVIGLVLAVALFMRDRDTLGTAEPADGLGLYLPIAFVVFGVLALRYISKDEKLVRSADRLR